MRVHENVIMYLVNLTRHFSKWDVWFERSFLSNLKMDQSNVFAITNLRTRSSSSHIARNVWETFLKKKFYPNHKNQKRKVSKTFWKGFSNVGMSTKSGAENVSQAFQKRFQQFFSNVSETFLEKGCRNGSKTLIK